MKRFAPLILCLLLYIPISVQAQSNKQLEAIDHRVELLEKQFGVVRDYNDDFLATVYWALGTIAAIAILLTGFGWFSNFRLFEREKASLREELERALASQIKELSNELRDMLASGTAGAETKAAQSAKAVASTAVSALQSDVNSLRSMVYDLQFDAAEAEVSKWLDRKVFTNAVRSANDQVNIAHKIGDSYRISGSLDQLLDVLKRLNSDSPSRLETYDLMAIEATVASLANSYPTSIGAIQKQLAQAKGAP